MDGLDVADGQVDHHAERVAARTVDAIVHAHAQPDAGPVEVDEVALRRARREPQRVAVEARHVSKRSVSVHTSTPASPVIDPVVILPSPALVRAVSVSILRTSGRTRPADLGLTPMSQPTPRPATEPSERRVEVAPGVSLHVEQRLGNPGAAPFVLVHGLASNVRLWDGVAERLHALGHSVFAIDQRGHGRADAPAAGYDLETAVADLLALIGALGLERPVLAGQSWGGNVVLELGWRQPEVVRGIACVDGGVIELADWFPTWEDCLTAMTPPRLDHLTLAELEAPDEGASSRTSASAPSAPTCTASARGPTAPSSPGCSATAIWPSCARSGRTGRRCAGRR